jgi:hypothetical protein
VRSPEQDALGVLAGTNAVMRYVVRAINPVQTPCG